MKWKIDFFRNKIASKNVKSKIGEIWSTRKNRLQFAFVSDLLLSPRAISRPTGVDRPTSAHLTLRRDGILTRGRNHSCRLTIVTAVTLSRARARETYNYNRRLSQFEHGNVAKPVTGRLPHLASSRRTCVRSRATQVVIFVVLVYSLLSLRSRAGQVCTRKRNDLHSADCQTIFIATYRLHL